MDYKKKYKQLHKFISDLYPYMSEYCKEKVDGLIPELKESEDEKIKKAITEGVSTTEHGRQLDFIVKHWKEGEHYIKSLEKQGEPKSQCNSKNSWIEDIVMKEMLYNIIIANDSTQSSKEIFSVYDKTKEDCIAWLEKQGEQKRLGYPYVTGWIENRSDNKPQIKHSVLMLTTHGVVEGEWLGDGWYQYRWTCKVKDTDVLYWLHLSDLESLEKEGNNNSISSEEIGKSIIKGIASSLTNYLDNNRYAGAMNMSNMECKDLEKAILDSDWEKMYRYMQKKLEKQGGQKSYWSEEDDIMVEKIIYEVTPLGECPDYPTEKQRKFYEECNEEIEWLKSIKQKFHWKPTKEQLSCLKQTISYFGDELPKKLQSLYNDLKKL